MTLGKMRVGAIHCMDEHEVRLFGFGEYIGDEIPEPGVTFFGIDMHRAGRPNPTILLDSGVKVYGCECWWTDEGKVKRIMEGKKVIEVDIRVLREEAANG